MFNFGNMAEKRICAERTIKIITNGLLEFGLITRKILKTNVQHKICPKMQNDLLGVQKHLKCSRMIYLNGHFF